MYTARLKKIFGSRTFFILFALVASLALWLYITYIENPDTPNYISGISVQFENADILASRNLIMTNTSVQTVSIRFLGTRENVSKLNSSNLTVSVDLSTITSANGYNLQYTINYPTGVDAQSLMVTSMSVSSIFVNVENLLDKTVPVTGVYSGGTPDGYMVDTLQFNPDTITVSGPESVVSRIAGASVSIPFENLTATAVKDLPLTFVDSDNKEITSDYVTPDQTTVRVTVPVLMVKDVPLKVTLNPGAGATESNTEVTVTPTTVKLAGDPGVLSTYNSVPLGTVDLSTFDTSTTISFPIAIPNGIKNLTGTADATAVVTIHGLDEQHFTVDNIQLTNIPNGKAATLVTQSLDVKIRGEADELSQITASNLRAAVDVSDLDNGTYSILAKIYVDSSFTDIGAVGDYNVTVTISDSAGG